jgi:hypothetical protein
MMRLFVCLLVSQVLLPAQNGLSSPWQLKRRLDSLDAYCQRLTPIVDQVKPASWRDAPPGYVEQQQTVKVQLRSIQLVAGSLGKDPERLPVALDLFFRYENFDLNLASLLEGIRRYHNSALADLIAGMRTENAGLRETLRDYMIELANAKEQEFRIADQEAQRCRSNILKQPARRQ